MKSLIKKLYQSVPFKKEIFTLLKQVWTPSENIYQHLYFKGVIDVPVSPGRSFKMRHHGFALENRVFWTGLTKGWEKESIKLWLQLCEQAEVVFDLGSNTGVYSLMAKTVNPRAQVFAFEPVHRVCDKLKENIRLNGYDIEAYEKAVSDKTGTAIIYDTAGAHTYSVTVNKNLNAPSEKVVEIKIETIALQSFIQEKGLKKIDLMKIDVETHEPEVLEGMGPYLKLFKPTMLIEILNDEIGTKIEKLLEGMGYIYFNIDEIGPVKQVDRVTKSDHFNFLICQPEIARKLNLLNG